MKESLFSALDDFGTDTTSDELEEYLNTLTISIKNLDPIAWWYAIGISSPLAQMAIDFLSAPGMSNQLLNNMFLNVCPVSSCNVEHGFSHGGLTVTKLRHALSDDSTRASTILHAWSQIPGLIPEADIIELFKDKCRRLKGKGKQGKTTKDTESIVISDPDSEVEDED